MPEVHRGYYDVSGYAVDGFMLHFRSREFEHAEMEDFLLGELAVPYLHSPAHVLNIFDEMARTAPVFDGVAMIAAQRSFIAHYRDNISKHRWLAMPPLFERRV